MKQAFENLRALKRTDKTADDVDKMIVSAGLDLLEQFMGDVHRIANALERIADVQDGTNHKKWAQEYRERTGKSWVP